MNNEAKATNKQAGSNYREPQPEGKVPAGNKAVKKPEDKVYKRQEGTSKASNPAKYKENSEQPVHPVKAAPKHL